jgi:hypothetical protein
MVQTVANFAATDWGEARVFTSTSVKARHPVNGLPRLTGIC